MLSRIIRTGHLTPVIDWGITTEDFTSAECQSMYGVMLTYYSQAQTSGSVWGPAALRQYYPTFPLHDDASMTLEALCHEVRKNRVKADARQTLSELGDLFQVDPVQASAIMVQRATKMQNDCAPKTSDVHFFDGLKEAVEEMDMIASGIDVSVCPWPWSALQKKTSGVRAEDYIVFFGRPKSMKSWILCYIIAWFFEHGKRLLVYTKEMPAKEICERVGCIIAQVDYGRFITGAVFPEERQALYSVLEFLDVCREQHLLLVLSAKDAPGGHDTVSWLASKVEKYKPEAVFVDGMYLMKDQQGAKQKHEKVRNISNDLRQMILSYHVPVIATVQANRNAEKNAEANTDEVAFSDSLGQDCTHLMRVVKEKGTDSLLIVMGNVARRFKLLGFRIHAIPATNFSLKDEEVSEKEIADAVKKDDETPKGSKNKGSSNGTTHTQAAQAASAVNLAIPTPGMPLPGPSRPGGPVLTMPSTPPAAANGSQ